MLGAALIGVFWQQLAGIGHDLGHSGVTHDFYKDHLCAARPRDAALPTPAVS